MIQVLVVADGDYVHNPTVGGINLAPGQDVTDDTFTISQFVYLLQNQAGFSVTLAHRREDPSANVQNFNFASNELSSYDVIWLFGYEGLNASYYGTSIGSDEVQAIAEFMDAGGGVFATGDHAGMGSYMCGQIPRVRSMRKWFGQTGDIPAGCPTSAINYAGTTVPAVNWPALEATRADTLQRNPTDTTEQFQFDDQSDGIPQLLGIPAPVHPILQGPNGTINRFPDHMHEGEVVIPANLSAVLTLANGMSFIEFPSVSGNQPVPSIIATGDIVPGHITTVEGSKCEQMNFFNAPTATIVNTIGILCAYDGRPAGVGRVVTDSSFHHYLDLNLIGDPCGTTPDRQKGFGLALAPPESGSVLADLLAFYSNTVIWLAKTQPPNLSYLGIQFAEGLEPTIIIEEPGGIEIIIPGDKPGPAETFSHNATGDVDALGHDE